MTPEPVPTNDDPVMEPGQPGHYYGHGLPYLRLDEYPGRIIAIEGTDGVGRSTQIQMLRDAFTTCRPYSSTRRSYSSITLPWKSRKLSTGFVLQPMSIPAS